METNGTMVLGRFGLQAGNLMINPQLDGMKGLSAESIINSEKVAQQKINIGEDLETDQAVDDLLASCGESDCWLSYSSSTSENNRKRKRDDSEVTRLYSTPSKGVNHEMSLTKQLKEVADGKTGFEDDTELNNELMKFQIFNDIESITANNSIWQ
ncbi:Uncharacterized protein GBIM_20001 [Gryllus bimaculatus]|nr:Uncharacterized protein GBIM_20001 [Gryllus bimaculatus]